MRFEKSGDLAPAFVLGGGVNGLGAVRSLAKLGVKVDVFDKDSKNIAFASRFTRSQHTTPKSPKAAGEQILREASASPIRPALIITSDYYLDVVNQHREEFLEKTRLVLAPEESVRCVLDKHRFNEFAWKSELGIARGINFEGGTNCEKVFGLLAKMELPILVKPSVSGSWTTDGSIPNGVARKDKAIVFEDKGLLLKFLEDTPTISVVLQEYIPGNDDEQYSLMCYLNSDGQPKLAFGIRKFRLCPIHNGVAALAGVSDDPELFTRGLAIVESLGYRGVASVCFKRSSVTGKLICYEVNGRLPLSHRAGCMVGRSLVQAAYWDACGVSVATAINPVSSRYYWQSVVGDLNASISYWRQGELGLLQWSKSMLRVKHIAEWQWNDPLPIFASFLKKLRKST